MKNENRQNTPKEEKKKEEDREERTERPMQRIIPLIDCPWFS